MEAIIEPVQMDLTDEQLAIVDRVCADKHTNFFITGPAGTGKTVLLTNIFTRLEQSMGSSVKVVTATGVAASNCKGQTIHSMFGINAKDTRTSIELLATNSRCGNVDALIIDEISSVSNKLFFIMHKMLQNVRKTHDKPFGGAKIIIFGDFKQIGPVSVDAADFFFEGDTHKDGQYCFETQLWADLQLDKNTISLTHIFRQEQDVSLLIENRKITKSFLTLLRHVRAAQLDRNDCHKLVRRVLIGRVGDISWTDNYPTHLFGRNADADNINTTMFKTLPGPDRVFNATYSWLDEKGALISKPSRTMLMAERTISSTVPATLRLRLGARVMVRANNNSYNVYNGMCGTVVDMSEYVVTIKLSTGEVRKVGRHKHTWAFKDEITKRTVTLVVDQISLCLAWAMTIHKAQGLTLDLLVLDMSPQSIFEPYQAYVGLSRARKLSDVFLVNFTPTVCRLRDKVSKFYGDETSSTAQLTTKQQPAQDKYDAYDFDALASALNEKIEVSSKHANLVHGFVKHGPELGTRSSVLELRVVDKPTLFAYGDNIIVGVINTRFLEKNYQPDQFIEINNVYGGTVDLGAEFKAQNIRTVHSVFIEFIRDPVASTGESIIVYMKFYAGNQLLLKLSHTTQNCVLLLTGLATKYIAQVTTADGELNVSANVRILKSCDQNS